MRAVFAALALFGLALVVGVVCWVPESLPAERRLPDGIGSGLRGDGPLPVPARLAGLVLARASANAAIFAYLTGASFVFTAFGLSATTTSLVLGINTAGCLLGSLVCGYLVNRISLRSLLWSSTATASAVVLAMAALLTDVGALLTAMCLFISIFAFSVFFPRRPLPHATSTEASGATSALLGCTQFLIGASVSLQVGVLGATTVFPMAAIMAVCLVLALLTTVVVATPARWFSPQTMLPQPAPEIRRKPSPTSADSTIKVDPISMLREAGQV